MSDKKAELEAGDVMSSCASTGFWIHFSSSYILFCSSACSILLLLTLFKRRKARGSKSAERSNADVSEAIRCASCGTAENDDIKLKECDDCDLARYCSVKCQKEHRKKHKKKCKKRAAELRDELLFRQPESTHLGDCPICCIPLALDPDEAPVHASLTPCCSKLICGGCNFSHQKRQIKEKLERTCPFCRHPTPKSQAEANRYLMKRVEANDPVALREVGTLRSDSGDCKGAFEYWKKAAELGDVMAHYQLSCMYGKGEGVEKDERKEMYHLEEAAIGGFPRARFFLGCLEWNNRQYERAVKHFIIAATLGHDGSLTNLKALSERGIISEEDFASTLRAHQDALDAMKSPFREAAAADVRSREYSITRLR